MKRNNLQLSEIQHEGLKTLGMLFRQHYAALCAYGHKYVDFHDAEEIIQDSLLWVREGQENSIIRSSLSPYLFKIVYYKALDKLAHIDAIKRADMRFYEKMQEMIRDVGFHQIKELTKRAGDAVAALPESYRQAFVMHRFRDMGCEEVAETPEVSPKTVNYRVQQALRQLRVDLEDCLPLLFPSLFP